MENDYCEKVPRTVEMCSYADKYGTCPCEGSCKTRSNFSYDGNKYRLAKRSDGKCYCGKNRDRCPNYRAYGVDCQGFE